MSKKSYIPRVKHPGEMLLEFMEKCELNCEDICTLTGISSDDIYDILLSLKPVDSKIARKFESITDIPLYIWITAQKGYDRYIHSLFH